MKIDSNFTIPLAASHRGKSAKVKGASGEREALSAIVMSMQEVERELGLAPNQAYSGKAQRNLQQSIAGGHDLSGLPGLAVEVKRCETLQINTWWDQCISQASADQLPVLLFRQSRSAWRCLTFVQLNWNNTNQWVRAEISLQSFLDWYMVLYRSILLQEIK